VPNCSGCGTVSLPPSPTVMTTFSIAHFLRVVASAILDNRGFGGVTTKNGTRQYSFDFYLYKFPGSREARGHIQDLLKAGQYSAFKEDAR